MDDVSGEESLIRAGRTAHYGEFYELQAAEGDVTEGAAAEGGDIAIVIGNCQAESLRIMLHGAGLHTVRVPPVHELVASDIPFLHRLLARARLFVSQPVRDDYHSLAVGTRQLSALLPAAARTVLVPVIRVAGLYPTHAIIRPPSDLSLTPPIVAYHDLRTLAEAAGGHPFAANVTPAMVHAIADDSLAELVRREVAFDTVPVSDLFVRPHFGLMRTLNHPANPIFAEVADRVRHRIGLVEHRVDAGRPLLNSVHAPRMAAVIDAFELGAFELGAFATDSRELAAEPSTDWIVNGVAVSEDAVRRAHLGWYLEHPDAVSAGLARHRRALEILAGAC